MAISVALATLGCKVNQAESEELRRELEARGYLVTEATEGAQVYVINTCTVTHIADRKSRNLVQRACRANPQARVLVTGCYAQRGPQELAASPQVRVAPKGTAEDLARQVEGLALRESRVESRESGYEGGSRVTGHGWAPASPWTLDPGPWTLDPYHDPTPWTLNPAPPRRSRALVKAQDGCDQHCTYCAVPLARGRSRSLPGDDVVRRVEGAVAAGCREVVLTGVNLTYYGQEWGASLGELLDRVLDGGPDRLRLSSLQPQAISDSLLLRWRDGRLCRHFHLAIQSGSDAVLRRMGRRYSVVEYRAAVERIRRAVPGASITTDVMVGFPGETQEEFEESYNFCRDTGFARMHVFQYSSRPGTAAARLTGAVPARVKAARSQRMLALSSEAARAFREAFLGSAVGVLFEETVKGRPGLWRGFTDNYLEVYVESERPLANQLLPVKLQALSGDIIWGSLEQDGGQTDSVLETESV